MMMVGISAFCVYNIFVLYSLNYTSLLQRDILGLDMPFTIKLGWLL